MIEIFEQWKDPALRSLPGSFLPVRDSEDMIQRYCEIAEVLDMPLGSVSLSWNDFRRTSPVAPSGDDTCRLQNLICLIKNCS